MHKISALKVESFIWIAIESFMINATLGVGIIYYRQHSKKFALFVQSKVLWIVRLFFHYIGNDFFSFLIRY